MSATSGVIFQDRSGFIWVGTEGNDLCYFHPQKNFITRMNLPDVVVQNSLSLWARSALQDSNGNWWMGFGGGLLKLNERTGKHAFYQNTSTKKLFYSNSIRSLFLDEESRLWVGTSSGMNVVNVKTGKIDSLTLQDSFAKTFYWKIYQDSRKNIIRSVTRQPAIQTTGMWRKRSCPFT